MNDSSDRARLLYKLIKPPLHPASLCERSKSQPQWWHGAQRAPARTHVDKNTSSPASPAVHCKIRQQELGELLRCFGQAADECKQVLSAGVMGEVTPEVVLNFFSSNSANLPPLL